MSLMKFGVTEPEAGSATATVTTASGLAMNRPSTTSNSDVDMESLNAALHELGMLSSITESRRQYLRETIRTCTRSTGNTSRPQPPPPLPPSTVDSVSGGFCVLHMNSNYVTDLRLKVKCENATDDIANEQAPSSSWVASRKWPLSLSRRQFQKPYSVPSYAADARLRRRNWSRRSHHNLTTESSSSSSSRDGIQSGNRSNPGSPEKGAAHRIGGGGSKEYAATAMMMMMPSAGSQNGLLLRSRSLDDIEAVHVVKSFEQQPLPATRVDIDNVSARLGHLHVN